MQHILQQLFLTSRILCRGECGGQMGRKRGKKAANMTLNLQLIAEVLLQGCFIHRKHGADTLRLPGLFPVENIAGKAFVIHQGIQVFFHNQAVRGGLDKLRGKHKIIHDTAAVCGRRGAVQYIRINENTIPLPQDMGLRSSH